MDWLNKMIKGLPEGLQGPLSAGIILLVGIMVAWFLKAIVAGAINRTGLGKKAKTSGGNIGASIGKAVFWLVILYAIYLALGRLNMSSALEPINALFTKIADFIPNLIGAGFTLFIGFIVASVAKNATVTTLEAVQVDKVASKTGLTSATGSKGNIARTLGTLVFALIIIPVGIAALSALQIKEISTPLSEMLGQFTEFFPRLLAASVILAITIFIGKWISGLLQTILPTFGFDRSINEIGMLDDGQALSISPSKIAGNLAFIIILVLGLTASVNVLQVETLSNAFESIQNLGGRIITAAITIVAGVFLANFVSRIVKSAAGANAANILKYAVIVLATFMGLSQLGIGSGIVEFAFMAILGAAAVAVGLGGAIAIGLGGKDWAGAKLKAIWPNKTTRR